MITGAGDVFGRQVGKQDRLGFGTGCEQFAERIDDPRITRVVKTSADTNAIDANDVRLILDCSRLQQRDPVLPPLLRPVRRDQIQVGVDRKFPKLVSETKVNTRTSRHGTPQC